MTKQKNNMSWVNRLFINSRFWILVAGFVLSFSVAGFVQLLTPSGSLQIIRIEQAYGFISIFLLWLALLASPLTKAFPGLSFKEGYLHARRAIGVLAFYYALLHGWLAFTVQLGGLDGIRYYTPRYSWSLLFGAIAISILFVMAATSLDVAVRAFGFRRWKLLHRLVYIAGISILIHIALIGSHFTTPGLLSITTAVGVVILLWLEGLRLRQTLKNKYAEKALSK